MEVEFGIATKKIVSDLPCHPGKYVLDELEARGISQRGLATQLGRSHQSVRAVIAGRARVSVQFALALERAWGISAETWLNLQQSFDLTVARGERATG